jgi:hypothetical protein
MVVGWVEFGGSRSWLGRGWSGAGGGRGETRDVWGFADFYIDLFYPSPFCEIIINN